MKHRSLLLRKAVRSVFMVLLLVAAGLSQAFAQSEVPEGALNAQFTVSEGHQVYFSQGNLQYQASTNTWRFAESQLEYLGEANNNISSTYDGWIDLFGWGTSGYNHGAYAYQPWSSSDYNGDYFVYGSSTCSLYDQTGQADWGYNAISNGGNTENSGWRTLTQPEWEYLLYSRNVESGIRFAKARVNNIGGVLIFPDNWEASLYNLNSVNYEYNSYSENEISLADWTSVFEPAGVVFLPENGFRGGSWWNSDRGDYWASTRYDDWSACGFFFEEWDLSPYYSHNRSDGKSVRLARFVQEYSFNINVSPSLEEGGTVGGGGAFAFGETCTVTAAPNEGYIFKGWMEYGTIISTETTYSFAVTYDRDLVAYFVPVYATLSDDFNDGEINMDYWTVSGHDVFEADGMVQIQQNWTDDYVALESAPIALTSDNKIVVNRRFYLHEALHGSYWGDRYFYGKVTFKVNGSDDDYIEVDYYDDDYEVRHGTYIRTQIDGNVNEVQICDVLFDTWLTEAIVLDLTANTLTYYRNNELIDVTTIPAVQPNYFTVRFKPDGWWTGHYHNLDWVMINPEETTATVTVSTDLLEGGTVAGGGSFQTWETCTVTATPNEGYTFMGWMDNGNVVSNDPEYSFTVLFSDLDLVAHFQESCTLEPENLQVEVLAPDYTQATVSWSSDAGLFDLQYGIPSVVDFETGIPSGWVTIDADGDGRNWGLKSDIYPGYSAHESTDCAVSQSYANGALYPDNYLVSPQVILGGTITFWACAYSTSYVADVFGVAVSTGSQTNPSDFVTLQQWTMTSKGMDQSKEKTRNGNRAQGSWHQYTVDLGEYEGQTGYVAIRHFDCWDQWAIFVDDIQISGLGGGWTTVTDIADTSYTLTGLDNASNYVVQVRTSCGDGENYSNWVEIPFTTEHYTITASVDPEGMGTVTGVGTYFKGDHVYLEVTMNEGYQFVNWTENDEVISYDTYLEFDATSDRELVAHLVRTCTLDPDNIGANHYGTNGAEVYWEGANDLYDLRYRETTKEGFEYGIPGTWAVIDADGDGFTWCIDDRIPGYNSNHSASSASYDENTLSGLTPDNYLVTPQLNLGGKFTFWAAAQDAGWAAEYFGVAVSTGSQTDPADFTTIQEWTMTAKGVAGPKEGTRGDNRDPANWYYYEVDLSEYAGQTGYVAIRHFNCTDMYFLNVDDVEYFETGEPEWTMVPDIDANIYGYYDSWYNRYYVYYYLNDLVDMSNYRFEVRSNCGDGEAYSDWIGTTLTTTHYTVTMVSEPEGVAELSGDGMYYDGWTCYPWTQPWLAGYRFVNWTRDGEVVSDNTDFSFTVTEDVDLVAHYETYPEVEGQMEYLSYDWQTNSGARTWTHVWPNGDINFAYTVAKERDYTDRGTGIGTYHAETGEWSAVGGRVENEKTGFGSIAQYGENGLVIAAHTSGECKVYIAPDKDQIEPNSLEAVSALDNTYVPVWASVMTSGANRDIIHVAVTAQGYDVPGAEGVTQPVLYFRSTDGGQTWDKQNVILPYLGSDYGQYWNSNSFYWMETTADNRLALVVNNNWSDGMVLYSDDDGETWERKLFYQHPGPFDYQDMYFYPRWASCQWDSNGKLHVLYEFNGDVGDPGSGSYYPQEGGVAYWNEDMEVMDNNYVNELRNKSWYHDNSVPMPMEYIGYLTPLTDEGDPENPYNNTGFNIYDLQNHGSYNQGVCGFPVLCMVPGSDDMVAVWAAMDENHTDIYGRHYYKIFARYSANAGQAWSPMVQLTKNETCTNYEHIYLQAAVVERTLFVAAQVDAETGSYLMGDDDEMANNFYRGFSFNLDETFVTRPMQLCTVTVSANPEEAAAVQGGGEFYEGAFISLEAYANDLFNFVNWTHNGEVISTNPTCVAQVTGNDEFVANYDPVFNIYAGVSYYPYADDEHSPSVSVNWEVECPVEVDHFVVYRTECSNLMTYTIVGETTEYSFVDETWGNLESGNYQYGVSGVLADGRATPIVWGKPSNKLPVMRDEHLEANISDQGIHYGHFTLDNPSNISIYNLTSNDLVCGSCYMNDVYYYCTDTGEVGKFVPENGFVVLSTGNPFYSIEYNPADGKMYGLDFSGNLYEVSPEEGQYNYVTSIGTGWPSIPFTITNEGRLIIGDSDGWLKEYVWETGELVALFEVGFDPYNYQDMAVNRETNEIYWATVLNGNALLKINLDNLTVETIGYFMGQVTGFAINQPIIDVPTISWTDCIWKPLPRYEITAIANPEEFGWVEGGGTYEVGTYINLYAYTNDGYLFKNWTKNDVVISTDSSIGFEVTEDATYVANFVPECAADPENLQIAGNGDGEVTITWTAPGESFELRYAMVNDIEGEGFEDGTLGSWTTIDADGDGEGWYVSSDGTGYNNSNGVATSASYINYVGALNPDNYLVSSRVKLGGVLKFYACAQDASWAAEHFGVAVSTTVRYDPSAYTTIQEWTMTSKGVGAKTSETRSGNRDQGAWYQYTVDLGAYSGYGYIAIRHFNCTDMFRLNVDDISYLLPEEEMDWTTITGITDQSYTLSGLEQETDYFVQVRSLCGDDPVYSSNWVGSAFYYATYAITATANPTEGGTVEGAGNYFVNDVCTLTAVPNENYTFMYWTDENDMIISSEPSYSINVVSDRTLVAHFSLPLTITATADPEEGGTVEGAGVFDYGTTCTLTATPNEGYTFMYWTENDYEVSSDATYSFEVTANRDLVAHFTLPLTITATAEPEEGGTVEGVGEYDYGTTCTLTATPNEGFAFYNWTENGFFVSSDASYSFEVINNRDLVAHFVVSVSITASADPVEGGTIIGAGEYYQGATCTLHAIPASGYRFVVWTCNGEEVSGSMNYTFVVDEPAEYVAHFEETPYVFVGDENSTTTTNYLPSWSLYNYSLSQQIYTADEIGMSGPINAISFYCTNNPKEVSRVFDIYLVHTEKSVFDNNTDWIPVTEADRVFSAEVYFTANEWNTFVFDQPFVYNGTDNLALIVDDNSGHWESSRSFRTYAAAGNQAIRIYNDNIDFDPFDPQQYTGTLMTVKNNILLWPPQQSGDTEQAFELSAGWNWMSSYIECTPELFEALKDGIAANNTTAMIKDMSYSTMLQGGTWSDSDLEFVNEGMYMANLENATTVTLTAAVADPTAHPITLSSGWNWIGFVSAEEIEVNEALASLTPTNGDLIKNMTGASSYNGTEWQGSLENMMPGSGYMYFNKGTEMTLTYPASSKGVVRSLPVEKYWSTNVHEHATNLVLMATLDEAQFAMTNGNYEIGAFVGDECRGSARLQKAGNGYVAFVVIHGDSGETVSFKLYDVMNAAEAGVAEERLTYVSNAITGSIDEPVVLHFLNTGVNEDANSLSVFPNPTKDKVMIQGQAIETVSVYNTLGQCLLSQTYEDASNVELDLSHLSAGVYTVAIRTHGTMVAKRVIKE